MKRTVWLLGLVMVLIASGARPAFAGSKEELELQAQMKTLVQMQQKTSEDMGVLREKMNTLVQQTTENLTRVTTSIEKLDKSLQQQQAASDSCVDQLTGQAQPLHNELTDLRARVDAVIKQLNDMNGFQKGAPANAPGASPTAPPSASPNGAVGASAANPR